MRLVLETLSACDPARTRGSAQPRADLRAAGRQPAARRVAPVAGNVDFTLSEALLVVSAVLMGLVAYLQSRGYAATQGAAFVALVTSMSMVGEVGRRLTDPCAGPPSRWWPVRHE